MSHPSYLLARRAGYPTFWLGLGIVLNCSLACASDVEVEFFEKKIRPVLVNKCLDCHSGDQPESDLRLDAKAGWERGGKGGPAIVPGDPSASLLYRAITSQDPKKQMPPPDSGHKLSQREIQDISQWIRRGAKDPRSGIKITTAIEKQGREHWAFQPIQRPTIPAGIHPIDFLIEKQLKAKQFQPAPAADLRSLIRRATYDLHGLPPTRDQLRTTMASYPKLLDQLLGSPRYGERWGRHWLDVARYSDAKDGVLMYGDARIRPFAYTYRDYVIRAFNSDKPFDRFIMEQLAADQLNLPADSEDLAAMGLLTLGRMFDRNPHDIIDDRIDVVTRGFLGLTVACSRCHDHKFDPIPTADYYSLYGIFASSIEPLIRPRIGPVGKQGEAHEKELQAKLQEITTLQDKHFADIVLTARKRTTDYLVQAATTEPDISETKIFFLSLLPEQLRPQFTYQWRKLIARRAHAGDPIFAPWTDLMRDFQIQEKRWKAAGVDPRVIDAIKAAQPKSPRAVAETYGKLILAAWQPELDLREKIQAVQAKINVLEGKSFDLASMVAGGDGLEASPLTKGIHPATGELVSGETGFIDITRPDAFVPVNHPFIDGVFVPKSDNVVATSTGIRVSSLTPSTGKTWDYFKSGPSSGATSNRIGNVDYSAAPHTILGIHANKGITFDIAAIRKKFGFDDEARFTAVLGHGGAKSQSVLDVFIFLDGKKVFEAKSLPAQDPGRSLDIQLPSTSRFLTLVVNEGGKGISHDQAIFGDAKIVRTSPAKLTPATQKKVLALTQQIQTHEREVKRIHEDPLVKLIKGPSNPYQFGKHHLDLYLSRQDKDKFRGLLNSVDAISVKHKLNAAPRAMIMVDAESLFEPVIFQRGDPGLRGSPVPRQFLAIASPKGRKAFKNGSGRLELAQAIVAPDNPLTARVWVNRVWMHHFGEPLVKDPSDFGLRTQRPLQHELLDFLAASLISNGWQTKSIHRLIMTSQAYQRSSILDTNPNWKKQQTEDPENQLIWRAQRRRLDLEQFRDTLLTLSGQIDLKMFGPPAVITEASNQRRTIYSFVERQNIPNVVKTFDFANADSSTARRVNTTVPQQSLYLLNSDFVAKAVEGLAERTKQGTNADRVRRLYQTVLGREPQDAELALAEEFLKSGPWNQYVHVLLMSNELMFID